MYIFCQCYMKTWHFKVSHSQKFRPLKCRFSLWSSPAKKPPNLNIVATISNSTQQPGRVFMMSFLLRDFVLMASNKSFNDHSGLWLLLSHIILSQTCSKLWNDSIEDSEVDNCMEKIDFADLEKNASQLQVLLIPANLKSDWMGSHKHGLAAKTVAKWWPLKSLLSRRIS